MKLKCRCGQHVETADPEPGDRVICSACGQTYRLFRTSGGKLAAKPVEAEEAAPAEAREVPDGAEEPEEDSLFAGWPGELKLEGPSASGEEAEESEGPPVDEESYGEPGQDRSRPAAKPSAGAGGAQESQPQAPEAGPAGQPAPREVSGTETWKESVVGSFVYAYAAPLAGNGWKALLHYAAYGAGLPLLIALVGSFQLGFVVSFMVTLAFLFFVWHTTDVKFLVPVVFLVAFPAFLLGVYSVMACLMAASVVGAMYQYLGHGSYAGSEPLQEAQPRFADDMLVPLLMVLGASILLGLVPAIVGPMVAQLTGGAEVGSLVSELQQGGGLSALSKLGGRLAGTGIIAATYLFALFCFPMVVMVLAASESVTTALNPVNVFRSIFKTPLEYILVWLFFGLNLVAGVLLAGSVGGALAVAGTQLPVVGWLALPGVMILAQYVAAVVGWRMGMLMNRGPEAFDHVS